MINHRLRRPVCLVLIGALTLVSSGCFGPYYMPEKLDLPTASAPESGPVEKVVVSNFRIGYWTQSSATTGGGYGYTIVTTTTTTGSRDGSGEIAQGLQSAGIKAVARKGVSARDLQPGQILLQANIDAYDNWLWGGPMEVVNILLLSCTLLIWGGILPFPFPSKGGVKFTVNLEAIDSTGNIFWTHTEDVRGYFRYMWIYGWNPPTGSSDDQKFLSQEIAGYLSEAISRALKPIMKN